jgi:hypothetical protein
MTNIKEIDKILERLKSTEFGTKNHVTRLLLVEALEKEIKKREKELFPDFRVKHYDKNTNIVLDI